MRGALSALLALCALMISACTGADPAEEARIRQFFDHVRAGEFDTAETSMAENLRTAESRAQLEAIRSEYIPQRAPTSARLVNWSAVSPAGGDATARFLHRYDYADTVLMVTTATRTAPGGPTLIEGFHVQAIPLEGRSTVDSAFTLEGATPQKMAFLGAMTLSAILVLIAFFGVIFTPGFKRKILFALVALAGAPTLTMNWETGEWAAQLFIGISLSLGFSATRGFGPFDPWMLKFSVPIGALIVLSLLWPRWTTAADDDDAPVAQ